MKTHKMRQAFKYLVWIVPGFLLLALTKYSLGIFENPLFFSIAFLYVISLPGWLLNRFFRFNFRDFISRKLTYFILGLSFYFILNFTAVFIGMNIGSLSKIILVLLGFIFLGAFLYDWVRPEKEDQESIHSKDIWQWENIFYLLPISIGILIIWLLSIQGPNLNGDPYFHLAIIRKALDGSSLTMRSLAFTKSQTINPAYIFPVWHIFLAFISKIFSISFFTTWSNIIYPLTLLSFMAWLYLAKIIFQKKIFVSLALSLMMIFVVYSGPAYLFSRLGVPDTFCQLVLLPLALAFALGYIFDFQNKKNYLLILMLAVMLLVMHAPHYFYFVILILVFGVGYAIFFFKEKGANEILQRTVKVLLVVIAVTIFFAIIMEFRSQSLISALAGFYQSADQVVFPTSFAKFGLVYKYSYFLLPIVIVFMRSKRILFLITSLFVTPLIYWTPLKGLSDKFLSGVFSERLLANSSFYFFIFTLTIILILILIDRALSRLSKNWLIVVNVMLILFTIILVILEFSNHVVSDFIYNILYAKPTNAFAGAHIGYFLLGGLSLAILVFVAKRAQLIPATWHVSNNLSQFLIMVILVFVLISPTFVNARNLKKTAASNGENYFLYLIGNDQEALRFVEQTVPNKSVILTSGNASKGLSVLTDQYMAYNAGSAEKKFRWVFDSNIPDEGKAEIVADPKWGIDYIYLENPTMEKMHFISHPELYQLIYNQQTAIFMLRK